MKAAIKSTPLRAKARFAQMPRPSGRPCELHRERRIAEAAATNVADPQGASHQTGDAEHAQLTLSSRSGHGGLDIGWKGQRSVHHLSLRCWPCGCKGPIGPLPASLGLTVRARPH
jgi:hypothetical protein